MNFNLSRIEVFIVHYSPLLNRLRAQKESFTWKLFSPKIVTESDCWEEASIYPFQGDLNLKTKLEIIAQCNDILHILDIHSKAICAGRLRVDSAAPIQSRLGHDLLLARPYYYQAIYAYSQKNYDLTLQHIRAMRLFLNTGQDYCLIIEDDSIPPTNKTLLSFTEEIGRCLDHVYQIHNGYFDISNSFGFHASGAPDHNDSASAFSSMAPGQTRCASAYILSRGAAQLILSRSQQIVLPVDWHISSILARNLYPTYWYSRPIFIQGSQHGLFKSNQMIRNSDGSL